MPRRRDILKGTAALGIGALAGMPRTSFAAGGGTCFIVDAGLPEAGALAVLANDGGHRIIDPRGEMIALLIGDAADLATTHNRFVGLSGYADFALARDMLRSNGRPIHHAIALDGISRKVVIGAGDDRALSLADSLLGSNSSRPRKGVTSFLWIA